MKSSFKIHPVLAYILFYGASIAVMIGSALAVVVVWPHFAKPGPLAFFTVIAVAMLSVTGMSRLATSSLIIRHINFRDP